MKIRELKSEFRLICSDNWGNAIDLWFDIAGEMRTRGLPVPDEWEYRPGIGDPRNEDSYFFDILQNATDKELISVGNYWHRYCRYLKHKGIDY